MPSSTCCVTCNVSNPCTRGRTSLEYTAEHFEKHTLEAVLEAQACEQTAGGSWVFTVPGDGGGERALPTSLPNIRQGLARAHGLCFTKTRVSGSRCYSRLTVFSIWREVVFAAFPPLATPASQTSEGECSVPAAPSCPLRVLPSVEHTGVGSWALCWVLLLLGRWPLVQPLHHASPVSPSRRPARTLLSLSVGSARVRWSHQGQKAVVLKRRSWVFSYKKCNPEIRRTEPVWLF